MIDKVISANPAERVDIIFCTGYGLNMSTSELLFFSRCQIMQSIVPKSFMEAIDVVKEDQIGSIDSVRVEPFFGATESAFRSFLEGNRVSEIYVYKNYKSRFGHSSSFDITPMLMSLDIVHWIPFLGYVSNAECEESFGDQCLTKVFG